MIQRFIYRKSDGLIIEFKTPDTVLSGLNPELGFMEADCAGNEENISQIVGEKRSVDDSGIIAPLEFLDRFTAEEIAAIESSANIYAAVFKNMLATAHVIELDNPRTIQGMAKLVEIVLLSEARKTEIMEG